MSDCHAFVHGVDEEGGGAGTDRAKLREVRLQRDGQVVVQLDLERPAGELEDPRKEAANDLFLPAVVTC